MSVDGLPGLCLLGGVWDLVHDWLARFLVIDSLVSE